MLRVCPAKTWIASSWHAPADGGRFSALPFRQNYCKASVARKLATLKGFFKFLIRREMLSASPFLRCVCAKQEKPAPKYLNPDQVQKLLKRRE